MSVENFAFGQGRGTIHVGLVNNMPDAALRATEIQFARLLKEAAGNRDVRLHLFSLPQIVRSEETRARMEGFYADAAGLPMAGMDALIVTGAEPGPGDLRDEPYWNALAHLVDWAEIGTHSTLFSCLAAHAAVLHLDGIVRRPLTQKLSGVFESAHGEHPLFAALPGRTYVPHSRRNTLRESDLTAKKYNVLSHAGPGVDLFARDHGHSLFVFSQGHPEYGGETLGREYLRDMGRFLRGESETMPRVPENYFDRATEDALAAVVLDDSAAIARIQAIVMAAVPLVSWRAHTLRLFSNWLGLVAARKARSLAGKSAALPSRSRKRA
jgi:homoserine O-succinyltransferase